MHLTIKNISVTAANAFSSLHAVGYPPMTAFNGFAHAIRRAIEGRVDSKIQLDGFAVVHHSSKARLYGKQLNLTTKKRTVYTDANYDSRPGYAFTPPTFSEPTVDIRFSLVLKISTNIDTYDKINGILEDIPDILPQRCLGGHINNEPRATLSADLPQSRSVGRGWAIIDQTHLISSDEPYKRTFDLLLDKEDRIFITQIGFRAISSIKKRLGARDDTVDHAFVEPVLGLISFQPFFQFASNVEKEEQVFWRAEIDRDKGTFLTRRAHQ